MLFEDSGDGRLDERGGEAREDGGDAAKDLLVDCGGLREVGDLGGATDVSGGGQDGVLKDGAEERVGTEALGGLREDVQQLGGGVGA